MRETVVRAEKSQIDADLGGEVIKQRTIILQLGAKAFFVYGFGKSQRANINDDEEEQFKEAAKIVLSLTEHALAVRLKRGDFVEAKSE